MLAASDPAAHVDWAYATAPLDTPASHFGPFAGLVETWQGRIPPGCRLPRRRDMAFEDFAGWLGRVCIAQIEPDPFDLRFTLWGTKLLEWWGVDYTGKRLGECSIAPEIWQSTELDYFAAMARAPFFGIASGCLSQHGRPYVKVVGLDLPFAEDGRLTHVICSHMRIEPATSVRDLLPDCPLSAYPPTS